MNLQEARDKELDIFESIACLKCGMKQIAREEKIIRYCGNCGNTDNVDFLLYKDVLQKTEKYKRALRLFNLTPGKLKKHLLDEKFEIFQIEVDETEEERINSLARKSHLMFDFKKFRYDVLAYRNGELKTSRRAFANMVNEKSGGRIIIEIELGKFIPKLELFWNVCKIMKKDPSIYFS